MQKKLNQSLAGKTILSIFALPTAKVAQLVEHDLAKVGVASSNLVFRSNPFRQKKGFVFKGLKTCSDGGTGRHAGLKILFP
jgi:hypothetical protein